MPQKPTKIIFGLVGEICSGKDTVADYLAEKYESKTISFSRPIRDVLDILYLPSTRENMAKIGGNLREAFGQDLFSRVIADKVKSEDAKIVVLPNVRLESDLVYLKKEPGFILVRVDCDDKTRFNRLKSRHQNPDDQSKTWEQFLADSQLYTEIHIHELAKQAKYSLDNNRDKEYLDRQIDELMGKI